MNCSKCGKQLLPNEKICTNCGQDNTMSNVSNGMQHNDINNVNINNQNSINDIPVNVNEGVFNNSIDLGSTMNNQLNSDMSVNNQNMINDIPVNMNESQSSNNIDLNSAMNNQLNPDMSANNQNMINDIPINMSEVEFDNSINLDNNMGNNKLDSDKKSKKGLIIILSIVGILLLIGIIVMIIIPFGNKDDDSKKLVENAYTMYVKINPLVKLSVKEKYYECKKEGTTKYEKCSEVTEEVVSYNLLNNDAKEIYKDIDLKTKNVVDALVVLYDTARKSEIEFTNIEITTNWSNRYSKDELVNAIKKQSKYSKEFNIVLDVEKGNISTSDILDKYGIDENVEIKYTVIFNSDGGSTTEQQEVKENEKVVKPNDPTRGGYNFVEWQLNGVKYDFDSEVKSDIELKAKWEKIVVQEEPPKQEESKQEEPSKKEESKEEPPKVEEPPKQEESKEEPPKEETKQESTLAKINLNDNIKVDIYGTHDFDDGGIGFGYVFSTNVKEIFANDMISENSVYYSNIENFTDKYSQLQFDSTKEQQALNALERKKNLLAPGVGDFVYDKNENNVINYSISYLTLSYEMSEQFSTLNEQLSNSINNFENKIYFDIFGDAVFFSLGFGFGYGPDEEGILLTEELCTKYNLTCARW